VGSAPKGLTFAADACFVQGNNVSIVGGTALSSATAASNVQNFQIEVSEPEPKSSSSYIPGWYAAFTLPRHEKRVVEHCAERQIESFLPLYRVKHRWKNRCTPTVELPLFPNYLFVRIDPGERVQVLKLPGVLWIVSSGRQLSSVPDDYITWLRSGLLAHQIEPYPGGVDVGDRVCITTGPMAGMHGILNRQKNKLRVVITLEMIGRRVAVEVGAEEISYAGKAPAHSPFVV
jgi:transcription antitermination factor NusG